MMLETTEKPKGRPGFGACTGKFAHHKNTTLKAVHFIAKNMPGFVVTNGWLNLPQTNSRV